MTASSDLKAPVLLLAMPQVLDPFFHRSVVLLVHHDQEGSFGFIINRPTGIRVAEILKGMEIAWRGEEATLAYFGGPVQPQLGTVLFAGSLSQTADEEDSSEVFSGVEMTQNVADLEKLASLPPASFRLFLGYAGWSAGQLVEEILRNDWLTAPVQKDLIFAAQHERVWDAALSSVGVDPSALPSWTAGGSDEEAN
jgi:putative transcriptional regulator